MERARERRDSEEGPPRGRQRSRPAPQGRGDPSRAEYRGSGRFRRAGTYEVEREWRRFEGTPQRELLRTLRERFLERALETSGPLERALEVGPGPGRFSPWVAQGAARLVLFELSPAMLRAALRAAPRGTTLPRRRSTSPETVWEPMLGDARRLPLRRESFPRVVALGNVVGFAAPKGPAVLRDLAETVAPGGTLLVESVGKVSERPRFLSSLHGEEVLALLARTPLEEFPRRLAEGWAAPSEHPLRSPGRSGERELPSSFQFLGASEVRGILERAGLVVRRQRTVAPLLGDDPRRVQWVSERGGGRYWRALLQWEETAGGHPRIVEAGGHLLTFATRPGRRGASGPSTSPG